MTKCGDTKGLIIYGCGLVWKEDRWGWIMDQMRVYNLFRDHLSMMTPNGRPRRKPKRLVERYSQ